MLEAKDLTRGKISSHLLRLALPIMGTSFLQMAYSFTDMAWLGRLSYQAVAAVGIVSVFIWIANAIALLTKTSSEVTLSHSLGKGEEEETRLLAGSNSTLSLLIGSGVMLLFLLFPSQLIDIYELSGEAKGMAMRYFRITSLGMPMIFLSATFFGIYNAAGHSHRPFRIMGIGLLINMLLDPLLIFGFRLGVAGSAWATLISQIVVCLLFFYHIRHRDHLFGDFALLLPLRRQRLSQILKIGLPIAMLNALFALVTMYLGRLASVAGGDLAVATLTTGGQLEALTWNTAQGITTALSTIVGQNFAAGKLQRLLKAYRIALSTTLMVGLLGSLFFIFAGQWLFSLIVPDPIAYHAGGIYLRISGYSQMMMMMEITSQGLLYGLGRSIAPAVISVSGNLLRIPLAILLVTHFTLGVAGIWWAISTTSMLKGLLALCYVLLLHRRGRMLAEQQVITPSNHR